MPETTGNVPDGQAVPQETAAQLRALLDGAEQVDARRVDVRAEPGRIRLRGAVASEAELTAVVLLAEQVEVPSVVELHVERHLGEQVLPPATGEQVLPPDGEVLVGDPDMLAGPATAITSDVGRAQERYEPFDPPDVPALPVELAASTVPEESPFGVDLPSTTPEAPAAPDLTFRDIRAAAEQGVAPPALDPEARPVWPRQDDELLDDDPDTFAASQEESSSPVAGGTATGAGTAGGGGTGGVPVTSSGARGADEEAEDPTRGGSGENLQTLGSERGPARGDDPRAPRGVHPRRD